MTYSSEGRRLLAEAAEICQLLSQRLIHLADGLSVVPLRSPTLPPATHTNMVLVGQQAVWVVDPATHHEEERELALAAVEQVRQQGRRCEGIVLTHHHGDHIAAADWLSGATGLPILAHPITTKLLDGLLSLEGVLREGDILDGGGEGHRWSVYHTPGHASGHIVLHEPVRGWLIGGDMVAAEGTIVIEPPDGHMSTYLEQLQRLETLSPSRLVPSHGEVVEDPVGLFQHYRRHRLMRESRVLAALEDVPQPLQTLTALSYPELPTAMHPLASRSCLAHLIRLEEQGQAAQLGGGWALSS